MSNGVGSEKRDLVLNPGEYAYLQDTTRGVIKTYVGPTVVNQTAQDGPVKFDPKSKSYLKTTLEHAVEKSPMASEGEYIVLENPAEDGKKPEEGQQAAQPKFNYGRKVNINGPACFALWPGQSATVVKGHHLRSNEYLIVRIYNEEQAKKNWGSAVVKAAAPTAPPVANPNGNTLVAADPQRPEGATTATETVAAVDPLVLSIGKLLVIKGTEVSFYMPPTGVEVVPDQMGSYVRKAVTLERLEYAILIGENGSKRYERGPQVVFPDPTETFHEENGKRKFDAIELNSIQGLHIKVIAPYTDDGKQYSEGDEIFITGDDCAIYFPRPEHSIITYGDSTKKHYATAVPAGEGRYVMDRNTGNIRTEKGPKMLLPNPISEVIVRRILSDNQCDMWYPGNDEAIEYNHQLREMLGQTASSRSGFVSEGEFAKTQKRLAASPVLMGGSATQLAGAVDTFNRGTTYTPPRQLTLNTKYDGVPAINIWTGYAVMVVSKTGKRRVEQGPVTVLLDYDETLEVLALSTGKPKTTDKLERTVYLRTANNKVSDIIPVETKDHVPMELKLSFRVNFEGDDPTRWFQVENYVKFLCDHVRSVLKGMARKHDIQSFHQNGTDIIRDTILGQSAEGKRPGMVFKENGMAIKDVEVLSIEISNDTIAKMLNSAQQNVVSGLIQLNQAEADLKNTLRMEEIKRQKVNAAFETEEAAYGIQRNRLQTELELSLAKIKAELDQVAQRKTVAAAELEIESLRFDSKQKQRKAEAEQKQAELDAASTLRLKELAAEADAVVKRFEAAKGQFSEALLALSNQQTLQKVAEALSVQNFIGGKNFVEVVQNIFGDTPLGGLLKQTISNATKTLPTTASTHVPAAVR